MLKFSHGVQNTNQAATLHSHYQSGFVFHIFSLKINVPNYHYPAIFVSLHLDTFNCLLKTTSGNSQFVNLRFCVTLLLIQIDVFYVCELPGYRFTSNSHPKRREQKSRRL